MKLNVYYYFCLLTLGLQAMLGGGMGAEFGVANGANKQKKKRGKKASDAADPSSEGVQVCDGVCGCGLGCVV